MYDLDFIRVGDSNGDAICLRYGENDRYYFHSIDGGYKDTGLDIVRFVEQYYGKGWVIHNMVLTHGDGDHVKGLIEVAKHFQVGRLWMNRPWLYAAQIINNFHGNFSQQGLEQKIKDLNPDLLELEEVVSAKGTPINEVFQGAQIGPFRVLAPSRERYLELIPEFSKSPTSYAADEATIIGSVLREFAKAAKKWLEEKWDLETLSTTPPQVTAANESSVIQYGSINGRSILLTADAGPQALEEAMNFMAANGGWEYPDIVQVPHHGSRRNVTPALLDRMLGPRVVEGQNRGQAICSIGAKQDDYPRAQVKNAFIRRGYPVTTTRKGDVGFTNSPDLRNGWSYCPPEPFAFEVEA